MRYRRLAAEPLVRSRGVVVVFDELAKEPLEVALTQRDDVIEEFPPQRSDESLDVRVLPRAVVGCRNLLDASTPRPTSAAFSMPELLSGTALSFAKRYSRSKT